MEAILLYVSDQWLSYSSADLIAVCSSMESAIDLAIEDAKTNQGLISSESIPEDEYDEDADYLEDVIDGFHRYGQFNGHNFGYFTRAIEIDKLS